MSTYIVQRVATVLVAVIAASTTLWSERRRGLEEVRKSQLYREAETQTHQLELTSTQLGQMHKTSMDIITSLQEDNRRLRELSTECETALDALRDELRELKDKVSQQEGDLRSALADNKRLAKKVACLEEHLSLEEGRS